MEIVLTEYLSVEKIWNHFVKKLPAMESFVWKMILALLAYLIIGKVIRKVCELLKLTLQKAGVDIGVTQFISSFAKAGMYFLLLVTIAVQFGIKQSSIVALLASASAALVLALQGGLSNLAGGVMILVLRPFIVGDYIMENVDKQEGTVVKIDLFYTTLSTIDNKRITVPNGTLTGSSIVNFTAQDRRNLEIKVMISYQSDLKKAKKCLEELLMNDPATMSDKEMKVFVDQLTDHGVVIGFRVWVKTEEYWNTKWRLNEEIKLAFDAEKIEIPYPQLDVHLN